MLALSIRQPYAELILRGMKTIEYRSRPTRIVGERFWIYASKGGVRSREDRIKNGEDRIENGEEGSRAGIWSRDVAAAGDVPPWMIELANGLRLFPRDLPTGVIVGSAVIERVTQISGPWAGGSGRERQDNGRENQEDAALSALPLALPTAHGALPTMYGCRKGGAEKGSEANIRIGF